MLELITTIVKSVGVMVLTVESVDVVVGAALERLRRRRGRRRGGRGRRALRLLFGARQHALVQQAAV